MADPGILKYIREVKVGQPWRYKDTGTELTVHSFCAMYIGNEKTFGCYLTSTDSFGMAVDEFKFFDIFEAIDVTE